ARRALVEQERYFRSLLHNIHEDILVIDADYHIVDVNHERLITTGQRRDEVIGRRCYEVLHQHDAPCDQHGQPCHLQQVFATGEPRNYSHRHVHADDSVIWTDVLLSPLCDERGRVTHVLEALRDVTDLMQMQEELRESERRYRLLAETAQDVILIHDLEGKILYLNRAGLDALGCEWEDVQGAPIARFVPASDLPALEARRARRQKRETARWRYETTFVNLQGERTPVEVVSSPIIQDEKMQSVLLVARDLTERKRMEEALRRKSENLAMLLEIGKMLASFHQTETLFQKIVESVIRLTDVDSAALYLFDQEREEPEAEAFLHLEATVPPLPPDFLARHRKSPLSEHPHIRQAITSRSPVILSDAHSVELSPAEKNICELRSLRSLLYLPLVYADRAIGVLIVGSVDVVYAFSEEDVDVYCALANQAALEIGETWLFEEKQRYVAELERQIRERRKAEEELQAYRERLEDLIAERTEELQARVAEVERLNKAMTNLLEDLQASNRRLERARVRLQAANEELNDFAYVVSHDLKAPLRGITQLSNWLMEDYAEVLDAEGHRLLELLVSRARRMHKLIEGILQYSRVGRVQERKKEIDLHVLVLDILDLLALPEHVHVEITSPLPTVYGEETRFRQVFQNLLSNAIKFLDKPQGRVTIGGEDQGGHWQFSVADNGPGIAAKYHDKIFQMFQTLAPRDEYESTGVGLALVKKIVES
ncbi:MAG: PAS domain-containing sensor histidine kinase, partial [Anaerolineae bacterium]